MLLSRRQCAYNCNSAGAARLRVRAQLAPTTIISISSEQLSPQQQAFRALEDYAEVCLADVSELRPGYKGLKASTNIQIGRTVLQLPVRNSLCIPHTASVNQWESDWLQAFEAAHGPLPAPMVSFLTARHISPYIRLAVLVLYIKRQANSNSGVTDGSTSSASSKGFWESWLQLLPPLSEATYAGSGWSQFEIQQLQLQPAKAFFSHKSVMHRTCIKEVMFHVAALSRELHGFRPPATADEASWVYFIAKTRCVGGDLVDIYPIHDFLNHADDPNCELTATRDGYLIRAVSDIPAGAELTISYLPPEDACNLELCTSWGFSTPTRHQDWALPQLFHLLPPIPYQLAVGAAAHIVLDTYLGSEDAQQDVPENIGRIEEALMQPGFAVEARRLAVAASSLPLAVTSGSSSSTVNASAPAQQYSRAASILQQFGFQSCMKQGTLDRHGTDLLSAYRHGDPIQAAEHQEIFTGDVIFKVTAAAEVLPASELQCTQHAKEGTNAARCLEGEFVSDLQMQKLSAAAVYNQCQMLLLQCGTTVQQDDRLLQLLQQQQHFAVQNINQQPAITADHNSQCYMSPSSVNNSTGSCQYQNNGISNSSSSDGSHTFQELLQQFEQLQQHVIGILILLQASVVVERINAKDCVSRGSSSPRSAKQAASSRVMRTTAIKVFAATGRERWGLQGPQQQRQLQHKLLREAEQLIQQQQTLLQQMLDIQQQQWPRWSAEEQEEQIFNKSDLRSVLQDARFNRGRLMLAVGFSLEQKQLLQLCARLAEEAQLQITAALAVKESSVV